MQFHLNGFRPGNPEISKPDEQFARPSSQSPLPEEVDVLIVGCGPAGLTLAAQLSQFSTIKTLIVDQKSGPLLIGQADGIACRTMEMFEAFGFVDKVLKEAYWVNETSFWKPDENKRENIVRSGRIKDTEEGLSEFPHVILNQARVHDFYLGVMRNSPTRLKPAYSRRLQGLQIDAAMAHPVTASFEHVDLEHGGQPETVRARYVVGCDGARSAVRSSLGLDQHGDFANQAWGVMDVLAVTDFPDIRLKAIIHSANEGNILVIPREGGYMVRLYIEMDKLKDNERLSRENITVDHLIASAKRILHPFSLEVSEVAWWSVYEIGQRLCSKFDDVGEGEMETRCPHVFIAGDACHTHSPKAGQGMNVSMGDSFNLGWKLASVIQGQCLPQILHSYSAERQKVAKELIDFDREFSRMFSAAPTKSDDDASDKSDDENETGIDPAVFQKYFVKQGRFTAGTLTHYHPSLICAQSDHQQLAKGFVIGTRFHSARVTRLADAKPVQLGHTLKADGRWCIFAFAGAQDSGNRSGGIQKLCDFLENSVNSPIGRFTGKQADVDSVIDLRAIFQQGHRSFELAVMPRLLLPRKGKYGLIDYEKMFCAELESGNDIFDQRGIERNEGCMVIVRPDQHVAHILALDSYDELAAFFDRFMIVKS